MGRPHAKTLQEAKERAWRYLSPAIDRTWYKYWRSGKVPDRSPAWAVNAPPPPIAQVIEEGGYCQAAPNLVCRELGIEIPHLGNEDFDGGIVAAVGCGPGGPAGWPREGYYQKRKVSRRFDLAEALKRPWTLLYWQYVNASSNQGHVMILLKDGWLLEWIDFGGGKPGLTTRRHVDDVAHLVTHMVYPEDWMLPLGQAPAPSPGGAAKPSVEWRPADPRNFTPANRPNGQAINKIVVHVVQGSYGSALNWFQNPAAGVSAHYTASATGKLAQSVSEANIAHHAGNWDYNESSVGIEHEGFVSDAGFSDAMYRSSAKLVAYLCKKYGIPADRAHILGHNEVPGATHTDPGPNWDWNRYMALVEQYLAAPAPAPTPAPAPADGTDRVKGAAVFSEARVVALAKGKGAAPVAFEVIPEIYKTAPKKNLRPDFLSVQFLHETGFGRYGGASREYNLAGIKKSGLRGDAPEDFEVPPTAAEGARMLVNHWCAVFGMDPVGFPHARYSEAKAHYAAAFPNGVADSIRGLGSGIWAADGNEPNDPATYGDKLYKHMEALAATLEPPKPPASPPAADPPERPAEVSREEFDTLKTRVAELEKAAPEETPRTPAHEPVLYGRLASVAVAALVSYGILGDGQYPELQELVAGFLAWLAADSGISVAVRQLVRPVAKEDGR